MKLGFLRDRYLEELKDLYGADDQVTDLDQKTLDQHGAADQMISELSESITKVEACRGNRR